jgi:hypothetical protein
MLRFSESAKTAGVSPVDTELVKLLAVVGSCGVSV